MISHSFPSEQAPEESSEGEEGAKSLESELRKAL